MTRKEVPSKALLQCQVQGAAWRAYTRGRLKGWERKAAHHSKNHAKSGELHNCTMEIQKALFTCQQVLGERRQRGSWPYQLLKEHQQQAIRFYLGGRIRSITS